MHLIVSVLSTLVTQEEFESLKEAASAALGDSQHKTHEFLHQEAVAPTATGTSSKIATLSPYANKLGGDAFTEVHSNHYAC